MEKRIPHSFKLDSVCLCKILVANCAFISVECLALLWKYCDCLYAKCKIPKQVWTIQDESITMVWSIKCNQGFHDGFSAQFFPLPLHYVLMRLWSPTTMWSIKHASNGCFSLLFTPLYGCLFPLWWAQWHIQYMCLFSFLLWVSEYFQNISQ